MGTEPEFDALVVGSGPNGLAGAITLARAGLKVKVFEAQSTVGGGARSAELTLPGFKHDMCSAVYPFGEISPFFRSLPEELGLRWILPPLAVAHPLDARPAVTFSGCGFGLSAELGTDAAAWRKLFEPWVERADTMFYDMLGPLKLFPRDPLQMARFGWYAMKPAAALANSVFRTVEARALFAGMAAHSILPLERRFSAATALALTLAGHAVGWPIAAGGSQSISNVLARYLQSLGGEIEVDSAVTRLSALPAARVTLLDISARQFAEIGREQLPKTYLDSLLRFRLSAGTYKIDWALSAPVPWRDPACADAGTVHVGGTLEEIAQSEREMASGRAQDKPFVLLVQPSRFDSQRCPAGKHILWGYAHVPLGCNIDMSARIENQVERFAPGFRDTILAKRITAPADFERYNRNFTAGDISGGAMDWPQLFARPTRWFKPYATPLPGVYLCSASTPPGPGVHGMCGYHAARHALRDTHF